VDRVAGSCGEAPKGLLKSIRLTGATGWCDAIQHQEFNQTMNAGFDEGTHGVIAHSPWASTKGKAANILVAELAIVKLGSVKPLSIQVGFNQSYACLLLTDNLSW